MPIHNRQLVLDRFGAVQTANYPGKASLFKNLTVDEVEFGNLILSPPNPQGKRRWKGDINSKKRKFKAPQQLWSPHEIFGDLLKPTVISFDEVDNQTVAGIYTITQGDNFTHCFLISAEEFEKGDEVILDNIMAILDNTNYVIEREAVTFDAESQTVEIKSLGFVTSEPIDLLTSDNRPWLHRVVTERNLDGLVYLEIVPLE